MKSLLRRITLVGWLVLLGWSTLSAARTDQDIEFAMQNPFLRDHFREREKQFIYGRMPRGFLDPPPPPWERDQTSFALERRVDAMVRIFLRSVAEKTDELKTALGETQQAAATLADSPDQSAAFASALRNLKDRADSLRSTLASVITDLPKDADFEASVAPQARASGFQSETAFLEEQTRQALSGIDSFLFHPGGTVTLSGLRGDDMLQSLHRVSLMAEALEKAIR